MKKVNLIITILFISHFLHGQIIQFQAGPNLNNFFDYTKGDRTISSEYTLKWGYHVGIGIEQLKLGKFNFNLLLSYDQYHGDIFSSYSSLGSSSSTTANLKRQMISLATYPLNFHLKKKVKIQVGPEFSFIINNQLEGSRYFRSILPESSTTELGDSEGLGNDIRFAINLGISYDIPINENISILPKYNFNFGLTKEYETPQIEKISNMLHRFLIGISWKLNQN